MRNTNRTRTPALGLFLGGADIICYLDNCARTLFTEWIYFLAGKTDQETIFLLVIGDILHNIQASLRDGQSLYRCLPTKLINLPNNKNTNLLYRIVQSIHQLTICR